MIATQKRKGMSSKIRIGNRSFSLKPKVDWQKRLDEALEENRKLKAMVKAIEKPKKFTASSELPSQRVMMNEHPREAFRIQYPCSFEVL